MIIEHESNPSWASAPSVPRGTPTAPLDEIEALLRRYPNVDAGETARILDFLTNAPIALRGSLSARSGMAGKMEQVRRDHAKVFRPSITNYLVFGLLILAIIVSGFAVAG